MLKVEDVLNSKSSAIWSIGPKDTAFSAMELMVDKNIGVLLVIAEEHVIGIFSERDFARNIILKNISPKEVLVEDLMTKDLYCITSDRPVEECMGVMTGARVRHMPVFANKRLKGVVTFGDIVKAVLLEQEINMKDLEEYHSCCESI